MPRSLNYPIPPRYRTTVTLDQTFDIHPNAMQFAGYFDMLGNSLWGLYNAAGGPQVGGPFAVNIFTALAQINESTMGNIVSTAQYTALPWYQVLPSGLNSLMPMYNKYRVFANKVKYSCYANTASGANTVSMMIASLPIKFNQAGAGTTAPTLPADLAALPRGKYRQFQELGTNRTNILQNYCSTAEACGVKRSAVQNDIEFSGSFQEFINDSVNGLSNDTTSPNWAWRFAWATSGSTILDSFTLNVKSTYYVELYQDATALLLAVGPTGPPPT